MKRHKKEESWQERILREDYERLCRDRDEEIAAYVNWEAGGCRGPLPKATLCREARDMVGYWNKFYDELEAAGLHKPLPARTTWPDDEWPPQ